MRRGWYSTPALPGAMKLRIVFPHVPLGGGETAMMEVAAGLAEQFELSVAVLDSWPAGPGLTIREELVERFGGTGGERVVFVRERWQLRPALADADAVLWYGITHAIPRALTALRAANGPASVRVVHTERPEELALHHRWRHAIDATVCVSPAMARRLPGGVFVPNPRPAVLHRGEPLPRASGRPVLGWIGRLAALKNVPWLVEHLADLGCDLLLQAIDTEEVVTADLARLAAERGVADRLRFLPPSRDTAPFYASIDALAVVSEHEGFPMVVLEAGARGIPVVATRVGALPEVLGEEVLFVESAGGVPVVESMRRGIAAASAGRGERLRAAVERRCGPEVVAKRYGEVVQAAISERPGRRAS